MEAGQDRRLFLAVGCGASLGALLRALVSIGTVSSLGLPAFAATGVVNVLGCLVIGFVATVSAPGGRMPLGPAGRLFLMTGVCGGFTTFSAMSLDAFLFLAAARPAAAFLYLVLVVLLSLAACWGGHALAVRFNR